MFPLSFPADRSGNNDSRSFEGLRAGRSVGKSLLQGVTDKVHGAVSRISALVDHWLAGKIVKREKSGNGEKSANSSGTLFREAAYNYGYPGRIGREGDGN